MSMDWSALQLENAWRRLEGKVHQTPLVSSRLLNLQLEANLILKCENLQKTGSFKVRGALHHLLCLSEEERRRGVTTHSSGNHGAALAYAASTLGLPCTVVVPENASRAKLEAMRSYGAQLVFCQPNLQAREEACRKLTESSGACFVHPYDHPMTILGQATATMEILRQMESPPDRILVAVGGGGLAAGACLACRFFSPSTEVWGIEPAAANDAFRSWKAGQLIREGPVATIADGLRSFLGEHTWPILQTGLAGIITVSEDSIREAQRLLWTYPKQVVEPSGAVPMAAFLEEPPAEWHTGSTVLLICGGNVEFPAAAFSIP